MGYREGLCKKSGQKKADIKSA